MTPMMLRVALAPAGGREGARPGPQRPSPDRCGLRHGRDPVRGAMCRECPRAQALRKWVRTPIWTLGMVQGGDAPAGPSDRMGSAWAARWASRRMGRGSRTVDHRVRPHPGCARKSRDQHHRKCRRNRLRRLGGLGSCGGVDRVSDPARLRADAGRPNARRSPRRRPRRSRCLAARRGFGCHLLQSRRLARRTRRRHGVVGDPQHPRRPVAPAPSTGN